MNPVEIFTYPRLSTRRRNFCPENTKYKLLPKRSPHIKITYILCYVVKKSINLNTLTFTPIKFAYKNFTNRIILYYFIGQKIDKN